MPGNEATGLVGMSTTLTYLNVHEIVLQVEAIITP